MSRKVRPVLKQSDGSRGKKTVFNKNDVNLNKMLILSNLLVYTYI